MTMDKEARQQQRRQQSLSHALSLLRGGPDQLDQPDQPDQPGSHMPGLQPRARKSRDEERAFLLAMIEVALAITTGGDGDTSIFVSSRAPATCPV
jgi:hypothetical protein